MKFRGHIAGWMDRQFAEADFRVKTWVPFVCMMPLLAAVIVVNRFDLSPTSLVTIVVLLAGVIASGGLAILSLSRFLKAYCSTARSERFARESRMFDGSDNV